ncbi:uncharacterized protein LOC113329372 isoform X1 [Papaver somniferum]|uniref:uncharacterized protein LOC113329372 isoform X1 n=1 Tax=Papaver somniferum TaxID=3469 RepID=UPI000E6FBC5B|nr:uncharacterized protein LOC113329372 isoform X1 [Papaver somniferum]
MIMLKITPLTCWILIFTVFASEGLVEGIATRKVVNNAIIKTIEVEKTEIIDCYDVHRQPSLNHSLLYNHTIQMRPSFYQKGMNSSNLGTFQLAQTWHKYGSCPEGTIPIRRKGKYYNPVFLRKHYYPRLSPTSPSNNIINNNTTREYAIIEARGNFLGAAAQINLWKPFTETNEMSTSQIWIASGEYQDLNTIEVGWHVSQDIYGDDQPRLFAHWTTDGYTRSGCFNLLCDGFVQTSSDFSLGCNFTEVSTFNGDQKDATFSISNDRSNGNWWVLMQGLPVGYYPSSLFTELSKTVTSVQWGGEIIINNNKGRHTSTQMGSGHFPSEGGLKTSSYFNWVQVFDENHIVHTPENIEKKVTNPNCYDLEIDSDHYSTNGYGFYYGGPGYNIKCQ